MPGYANRLIRITFPDLSDDDDLVWVEIRNPRLQSQDHLQPKTPIKTGADGQPIVDNEQKTFEEMLGVIAGLIRDWHMYDANSDDDDMPLLGLPATRESLHRVPVAVLKRLVDEVQESVDPQ